MQRNMHLLRAALLSHVMWAPASSMAVLPQGMWTHSSSMAVLDGHASASHRLRTSRAQGCVMLLANRLYFDQVDESLLLDHLGGFTNFCLQWGESEWRACSAEPLKFSVRKLPDASGIRLVYYLDQETAKQRGRGGLVEDGGLDILYVKREPRLFGLPSPAIVFRPERGRGKFSFTRKSGEDVIFDRLLVDCLVGRASTFCKLASGYQLPARARIFSQIEASCLYEKKVRKRF